MQGRVGDDLFDRMEKKSRLGPEKINLLLAQNTLRLENGLLGFGGLCRKNVQSFVSFSLSICLGFFCPLDHFFNRKI